ncbi:hypothetical protein Tco_1490307, partial [Tanacetum coccineum]
VKTINREVQLQALVDGKKIIVNEASVRRDLQLNDKEGTDSLPNATIFEELTRMGGPTENVADEAVYEEMDGSLERASTTATSLDAEQDKGHINKTQSKATPNEPSSLGTSSGGSPRRQETIGGINIVSTHFDADTDMFGVHDLVGDEVVVESEVDVNKENVEVVSTAKSKVSAIDTLVSAATTTVADEEMTLAQTLIEIKSTKPKAKGIVMQEPSELTPTISLKQPS